jgi:CheY-like chemotaxis protein
MKGEKKKILIVDDDNFLLNMYALKFSQNNFEVSTASGGMKAIEKLKNGLTPDVMLMDIIMPEMNGFEMLMQINKEKLCPSCAKIILSNKNEQADFDEGKKLGVAGYIVKANSTPTEVIDQVVKILDNKKI